MASNTIHTTKANIAILFTKAANASALPKPKECFGEGGRREIICARSAKPNAAASVTM